MGTNDVDRFTDSPSLGHNIFNDKHFLIWAKFEPSSQHEIPLLFFHKNESATKLSRHFLPDDQPTHRWRDHGFHLHPAYRSY